MTKPDELDRRLLYELYKDGAASVPVLSRKMQISPSVLYSRIRRLLRRRIIKKFTIQVDDAKLGIGVRAKVGINRSPRFKNHIHGNLMNAPEVVSITEVTGRFDIIVTIQVVDLQTLHSTVIDKIGKIDGIQSTETFVELTHTDKDPAYLQHIDT